MKAINYLIALALTIPLILNGASREMTLSHQPVSDAITINSPGVYKLTRNLHGPITIADNDVTLDLNGHTITGGATHAIVINNNASNVTIHNGSIGPVTGGGNGIEIATGSSNIHMHSLHIHQCNIGINATGSDELILKKNTFTGHTNEGIKLTTCNRSIIIGCTLSSNATGILIDQSNDTHIQKCTAIANSDKGFSLTSSNRTSCLNCQSLLTGSGSANDSFGFISNSGSQNRFSSCIADKTTTTATATSNMAAGFLLKGSESNSSIVNCTASGVDTPAGGDSTAYGIGIHITFSGLGTGITSDRGADAKTIAWNPKFPYIAVAGNTATNGEITLYKFNHAEGTMDLANEQSHGASVNSLHWSSDGTLLAVGATRFGSATTHVYSFSEHQQELTLLDSADNGADIYSVSFHPNMGFLATGGEDDGTGTHARLYQYKPNTSTLVAKDTVDLGTATEQIRSLAWHGSKPFLAIAGIFDDANHVKVYELNKGSKQLTLRESVSHGAELYSIDWTSDGKFVAVGGLAGTGGFDTRVYEFDSTAKTLTLRDSQTHGATVYSVSWSPNDSHLLIGGTVSGGYESRIYSFDQATKTLTLQNSHAYGATVYGSCWSPGGEYIALAGTQTGGVTHAAYPALSTAQQCIVSKNTVHGVRGNLSKTSTGIYVSNLVNLVASNTAYDNDRNYRLVSNINATFDTEKTRNVSR